MRSNYKYGKINALIALLVSAILVAGVASCKSKTTANEQEHAGHDMSDMPGMDMKEHANDSTAPKLEIKVDDLIKPVNQNIISQVATLHPQISGQELTVTAKGRIEYDQRRFTNIASRVNGRIESTNVKFQFQPVKKGQLLFTIYSPELLNAQQEFLFLSNDAGNKDLLDAARQKLLLLGLSDGQVSEIQQNKKALSTVSVYAPGNGYLIANGGKQNPVTMENTGSSVMGGNMAGSPAATPAAVPSSNEPILREGQYVNKGETVFRFVNTETVWGILKIFPDDVAKVKTGNAVSIKPEGNEANVVEARIDFIGKYFNTDDKTITARVYLNNQKSLFKIGDLISASITAGKKDAIWIPREAVLDIGNARIVFVKQGNAFKAKEVHTGLQNGNKIELISGISTMDEIVANAQYLVDSEAFIKTE